MILPIQDVVKRNDADLSARGSKDSSIFDDEMFTGDYSERYQVI
jgi:hypothetical protein